MLVRRKITKLSPSSVTSKRPFQKTIEGFDWKVNGRTLRATPQHSLGKHKHRAFRVGCILCWQQQASLRKTFYNCCNNGLVQESKKVLMLCKFLVLTSHWRQICFFLWKEIFDGIGENLLPIKAALISSLNLSVTHWSLSKNKAWEQIHTLWIKSCAKQQI